LADALIALCPVPIAVLAFTVISGICVQPPFGCYLDEFTGYQICASIKARNCH
jgi:hypothetical protein